MARAPRRRARPIGSVVGHSHRITGGTGAQIDIEDCIALGFDGRLSEFHHRLFDFFLLRHIVRQRCGFRLVDRIGIRQLERIALEDEYFVERKLYPNVDFYSGIILQAIGIPAPMFTP